jgi:hypothetical protein
MSGIDFGSIIEEFKRKFLASIREPIRIMVSFGWPGGKGNLASQIAKYVSTGHTYY